MKLLTMKNHLDLPSDGLRVGQCNAGDAWLECSHDDCNQLEVGGKCNNGGMCTQGQNAAVSIACLNEGINFQNELLDFE